MNRGYENGQKFDINYDMATGCCRESRRLTYVKRKDNIGYRRNGSFGNAFTQYVLDHYDVKKIIIYSEMNISSLS